MKEFNKKSDEEIYKKKKKSLIIIILITILFSPLIMMFLATLFICISIGNIRGVVISLCFLIGIFVYFNSCIKGYGIYLIAGRDVVKETKPKKNDIFEIFKKEKKIDARVEGIVGDREKKMIDKDEDGYILVSEFYPLTENEVLDKIILRDANFSKTDFYAFVKSVFVLMQEAWSENNFHKLRSFEADWLYYRHKANIEELIKANEYDIRDRIFIKGVLLKDFRIESGKEIIIVALTASMRRYYNNEITNDDYPYIMAFSRNNGVKTKENLKLSTTNCCNCGAIIDVSDDGICNYCNTSLVSGEHEWVLVDMKQINVDLMIKNEKD